MFTLSAFCGPIASTTGQSVAFLMGLGTVRIGQLEVIGGGDAGRWAIVRVILYRRASDLTLANFLVSFTQNRMLNTESFRSRALFFHWGQ